MLALRRFHLDTRSWDDTLVPFRNTPFEALFPDQDIAIISVDTDPTIKPSIVYDLSILDGWQIDFASGAKKHGDFFITPAGSPRVASFFWDTAEKAIAYGGNLVTDCESIHHVADLRVLVVNDGEYGTGDCHAKASPQLYALIDGDERRAVQFRLATIEKSTGYLAKGTAIVTTPGGPDLKHDLIIPLSSFKSYTPALGEHTWNAHFGVVSFSSYRPTRVSYTIIQWLSHETIETEIMPGAAILADQLLLAGSDTQSAIQFFKLVAPAGYDPEENILFNILRNDNHSRLTHHPYVVTRLKRLLRRRWLHLALGGGLRWAGLQAIPCDDIPDDQICIPQLPEGQIISTRYPVRSWADLKLWTNKHTHKGHKGVVWMNHTTALTVGGDFDGDYFLFATADDFPMIAAEIRIWQMTRSMQPIEKIKQRRATPMTSESMATVAMDNCDNMVGLLTYFVAQACAAGRLDFVASLAPEIQIAVDKFKYDLQHDEALIDDIATQLIKVEWLSNKKDSRVYLTMPLPSNGTDVISKLVTFINDLWEPPKLLTAPLAEFAHIFPNPGTHREASLTLCYRYGKLIRQAMNTKDNRAFHPIFAALDKWATSREDPGDWAAAVWHAAHRPRAKGTASLPFNAFPEAVIAAIQEEPELPKHFKIVGIPYGDFPDRTFLGNPITVRLCQELFNGSLRTSAYIEQKRIGYLSTETPATVGTFRLKLRTARSVVLAQSFV